MRRLGYLLMVVLAGCSVDKSALPPEAYRSVWSQWQARAPLELLGRPCWSNDAPIPATECYVFEGPRRWSGVIWQNDYFENRFVSGNVGPKLPVNARQTGVLTNNGVGRCRGALCRPFHNSKGPDDPGPKLKAFNVTFVGRRTAYPGHYGHAGHFEHLIIVDRMILEQELPPME